MADWYKKLGDDSFPYRCQLSWEGGYSTLAGSTIILRYAKRKATAIPETIAGAIEDATERIVTADFEPTESGTYRVEWNVEWPDGSNTTFPEDGYQTIEVSPALVVAP